MKSPDYRNYSSFLPFPMNLLVLSNFSHASTSKHSIFVLHICPHTAPLYMCLVYSPLAEKYQISNFMTLRQALQASK